MRRTATAILAASLLAAGCTTADRTDTADDKPTKAAPKTASPSPTFDEDDCRALLEEDFENDNSRDAHDDPECEALTRDEYLDVVKDVLTGRKDEIMEDAEQEYVWDEAWKATDAVQQEVVCEQLRVDGPEVVGREMAETAGDDEAERIEMAEYLLEEKC